MYYLERRFVYLDVCVDLVVEGKLPRPVRVGDAGVPHPGAEHQPVGSVVRGPGRDDELGTVHGERRDGGHVLDMSVSY